MQPLRRHLADTWETPGSSPSRSPHSPRATYTIRTKEPSLHNENLCPVPPSKGTWGLVASLFITAGINGWFVFAAIVLAGAVVMVLVNLSGKPSVTYGIPTR